MARFFYLHLGGLVGILVYFVIFDGSLRSLDGLRTASLAALLVHALYMTLARRRGELKQFDWGLLGYYALAAIGVYAGIDWLTQLYLTYSPALLFAAFVLTALLPPLFGAERFVDHFMRRSLPRWQLELPVTARIGRVVWLFWIAIFVACTLLAAWAPLDPWFTAFYPNLLIVGVGLAGNWLLPKLYLELFPPEVPDRLEPLIMGMPLVFDASAARGVGAEIQFCVSDLAPGDYWLRIGGGKCASFEGLAPTPSVTVYTPEAVWLRILRGELDGGTALMQGLYRVGGEVHVLSQLPIWFPRRREAA